MLTKQVQRIFSLCKIRLSKTPLCLGSLVCAHSLTQEIYCCALCSSYSWYRLSQCLTGLYPTWEVAPGLPGCWEVQLGKARRESMPRGRQNGGWGGERSPLPPALSSCDTATTDSHPEQALPSKGLPILLHLGLHHGVSRPVSYHPNPNTYSPKIFCRPDVYSIYINLDCAWSCHKKSWTDLCIFCPIIHAQKYLISMHKMHMSINAYVYP